MRTILAVVPLILISPRAVADAAPPAWQIKSLLEVTPTVILVRVLESTFTTAPESSGIPPSRHADVVVLQSWKGQFSAGRSLRVWPPYFCFGFRCVPYALRAGDEVVVFTQATQDPILRWKVRFFLKQPRTC